MRGLSEIAQSAGWFYPCREICIISERHNIVSLDNRRRLHSDIGPAIAYPDGFAIYAFHGVRVPHQVIEHPENIKVEEIDNENNAEVRRVMIERYGQDRYIVDSGAKVIQSDEYGSLYLREFSNDEPLVMVKVRNSTPEINGDFKDYFLRVPPTVRTAKQAVAWTYDIDEDEYEPLEES